MLTTEEREQILKPIREFFQKTSPVLEYEGNKIIALIKQRKKEGYQPEDVQREVDEILKKKGYDPETFFSDYKSTKLSNKIDTLYRWGEQLDPTEKNQIVRQVQGVIKGLTGIEPTEEQIKRIGEPGILGEMAGFGVGFIPIFATTRALFLPKTLQTISLKGKNFITRQVYKQLPEMVRVGIATEIFERLKTVPESIQQESIEAMKTLEPELTALTMTALEPAFLGIVKGIKKVTGKKPIEKQIIKERLKRLEEEVPPKVEIAPPVETIPPKIKPEVPPEVPPKVEREVIEKKLPVPPVAPSKVKPEVPPEAPPKVEKKLPAEVPPEKEIIPPVVPPKVKPEVPPIEPEVVSRRKAEEKLEAEIREKILKGEPLEKPKPIEPVEEIPKGIKPSVEKKKVEKVPSIVNIAKTITAKNPFYANNVLVKDNYMYMNDVDVFLKLKTSLPEEKGGTVYQIVGKDFVENKTVVPDDFYFLSPSVEKEETIGLLDTNILKDILEKASKFVNKKGEGEILTGVHIKAEPGKVEFISTDARFLYKNTIKDDRIKVPFKVTITNPDKVSKAIPLLGKDVEVHSLFKKGDINYLCFKGENGEMTVRVLEGKYPDVSLVFPRFTTQYIFEKKTLQNALTELMPYVPKNINNRIILKEGKDHFEIIAEDEGRGIKRVISVPFEKKTVDIPEGQVADGIILMPLRGEKEIAFDLERLLNSIKNLEGEKILMNSTEDFKKAFHFTTEEAKPTLEAIIGAPPKAVEKPLVQGDLKMREGIPPTEEGEIVLKQLSSTEVTKKFKPETPSEPEIPIKSETLPKEYEQIKNIIITEKDDIVAQTRLKTELGLNFSVKEIKRQRTLVMGGAAPTIAKERWDNFIKGIKKRQNVAEDYGLSKSFEDINPEIVKQTLGQRIIEAGKNVIDSIRDAIHSLEIVHTYLRQYKTTEPFISAINQSTRKLVKNQHDIKLAQIQALKTDNPEKLAEICWQYDRKAGESIFTGLNIALREGEITQRDYDAFVKGYYPIWQFVRNGLIREILASRLGVRVRSLGKQYQVSYKDTRGNLQQKVVSAETNRKLMEKYGKELTSKPIGEEIEFKWLDRDTGNYATFRTIENDYFQAVRNWVGNIEELSAGRYHRKNLGKLTKEIIDEILPYQNYIFHNRSSGKYWVNVYQIIEDNRELVYSARVPTKSIAEAFKKEIESQKEYFLKPLEIVVKPHQKDVRWIPPFGTMADVEYWLASRGIDVTSEVGQKIINSYRAMSGLMNHFIHAKNIPGYRTSWKAIIEEASRIADSTAMREFRLTMKDLKRQTKEIPVSQQQETLVKYLDNLASIVEGNPILDGLRTYTYFSKLANKLLFIMQNLTEAFWTRLRVNTLKLNNPLKFDLPLGKEYTSLVKKAEKEGLFSPMYIEEIIEGRGQEWLRKAEMLSRLSESHSSRKVYEIGLKLARDKGLTGKEAENLATDFLLGIGKPYYKSANFMLLTLPQNAQWINRYGAIFLRWPIHWINEFARGDLGVKLQLLLGWSIAAGVGNLPYGKRILQQTGLVDFTKPVEDLTWEDKFLLSGLWGISGIGGSFFVPFWAKGFEKLGNILAGMGNVWNDIELAYKDWHRYGIPGVIGHLPLAGLQYPILGTAKVIRGVKTGVQEPKVIYEPVTAREKLLLTLGITPVELEQVYTQQRLKKPQGKLEKLLRSITTD